MDAAEVELLNQHVISSKSIETEDFDTIDELEEVERDEEIGIIGDYGGNHQVEAIDVSQSSAMMLREVLDEVATPAKSAPEADDIIEYINYILLDAITQKASDIHFEPYESSFRIRFRIDGILHKVYVVPEQYRHAIAARLKVMAELDIAEKRLPQDGHITICLDENGEDDNVDARISVIPTLWGEKVVIRLLDRSEMNFSLTKLGLNQNQKYQLQSAIERSQGLVLVTGPTGSGKTVTLYACLNHLNEASKNIATVEDPVEINLEGINQLQVHPKIGLTFAEALRAFLRQDPDVLMVGEIRDYETADITMKAAQTGHLVLSTLHTNSAVESLVRLKNMGVESYNIASTVKLVIAQRLVRELCHCKEEDIVDSGYLETLGFTPQQAASKFYKASSCSECHDGYRGRIAIFEVMPISKRMEQMMLESAPAMEIRQQAEREGVKSLRQSGIEKVMEGRTSLEEILRVTTE
ncbi:MAG TPA: Flp pilus assembly complex ATPase component TadA [Candidatus Ignatzschineria merdigallinarum]|uniref:Flp pilus assembly complex ATPase component TadA n=1 Tax=Candidatus Ignatzschineria merdigallinarum TaxID=2838621 RepID=A0A9D1TUG9_9GAMM|nr:Flp pilus assembly complex ATPase component TadA [Candidatus Ignatzschineria merdigallinarum]